MANIDDEISVLASIFQVSTTNCDYSPSTVYAINEILASLQGYGRVAFSKFVHC